MTDSDLDDTARLILMTAADTDQPVMTPLLFAKALRANGHPDATAEDIHALWTRYRGWDGRTNPTHDVTTGRPIEYRSVTYRGTR